MTAREEILGRIRTAHRLAPPRELPYVAIMPDRPPHGDLDHDQLIELLVDRLIDYRALVRRSAPSELPTAIATALADRGVKRLVVPDGFDDRWLDRAAVTRCPDAPDTRLAVGDLDAADGVITTCTVAIAETGTLILDASPGQGRRAVSLVPDYHLCVVPAEVIVAGVPQGLSRLDPTRPLTLISGPSATSDIELNRVEGVHGPRTLEVIIVAQPG